MIDYTTSDILATFPAVLQNDKQMVAIATSIANQLVKRQAGIKNIEIYTRIMDLPEEVCDTLAEAWGITWYDYNYTLDTKRQLIATAKSVKRRAGTSWAVETVLNAIQPGYTVSEWYEYGGTRKHFKVLFNITDNEPMLSLSEIRAAIERVKRGGGTLDTMSWLIHIECEPESVGIYLARLILRYGVQNTEYEMTPARITIRTAVGEESNMKITRCHGGQHYFDGDYDFDGHINFDGTMTYDGKFKFDGDRNFVGNL